MSQFSDEEENFISENPLGPRIGNIRQSLRSITSHPDASATTSTSQTEETSDDRRDAISSLIVTLQAHPVAKRLRSKDLRRPVDRELALLYARFGNEDSDLQLQHFLPLTRLITRYAPDPEIDLKIWKAVLDLLSSLSRVTPPSSIPPSFGATPRTFTSASQQGSEQTKRLLEPPLREELRNCCYVKVGGFFKKYFEDKSWSSISDRIIAAVGTELNFPPVPTEEAVWYWVSQFQKKHLDLEQARGVYYTTSSKKDLTGSAAERQLDLFMKSREAPSAGQHHWGDVRVIGEHKESADKTGKFLQLARYAREVFSAQPTRLFVHGFLLLGTSMELHVFDRSGAFSAAEFDVVKEPEHFIRVLTGYTLMSDEELGMDTFVRRQGKRKLVTMLDDDLKEKQFEIEEDPITRQFAIASRATCCYCTVDQKSVVKFAWQSPKKVSEAEHLRAAHKIKGVAQLVASGEITTVEKLREGLTFRKKRYFHGGLERTGSSFSQSLPASQSGAESSQGSKRKPPAAEGRPWKKSRSNSQASGLSQEYHASQDMATNVAGSFSELGEPIEDTFRKRALTWLVVSPAGRPLSTFANVLELLRALRDAIKAHQSLFEANILHRDISKNNIIITDPEQADGYSGMLIDMDMATRIGPDGKNESSGARQMTGTLEFMAIEVLRSAHRDIQHTYRHDLESFFYVFLSICINHGWPDKQGPKTNPLQSWYTLPYKNIVATKSGHMLQENFEDIILTEFSPTFECMKGLARNLRGILFTHYIGTPKDHSPLYKSMIDAFDTAINLLAHSA